MKNITYITPIYKSRVNDLKLIYRCLMQQTSQNWFWVIYDDNHAHYNDIVFVENFISDITKSDNRVKYIPYYYKPLKGSGPAKNMAFIKTLEIINPNQSSVFCELDHDDLISKDCTETILFYKEKYDFDFLHANTIVLNDPFKPAMKNYCGMKNFQHPIYGYYEFGDYVWAFCHIDNILSKRITMNIRCYDRFFYEEIGGFDPEVKFGEDFDILIRITQKAEKIVYVDKELYFYNFNKKCSSASLNCDRIFHDVMEKNKEILETLDKKFFVNDKDDFVTFYNNIKPLYI